MKQETKKSELMTLHEACKKYDKYFFGFVVTKQELSNPYNSVGYVVYTVDTEEKQSAMPGKTEDGLYIGRMRGYAAKGPVELGDIVTRGAAHAQGI